MTDHDYTEDDIHDDVELMLNCTGLEILELIASDPKHYLHIVRTYNKTRDGRDIYLSDLFNILITQNDEEYRIKFKTCDNGTWYEVGYSGGEFTESEVLEAFKKKVHYAINRPSDAHRSAILDTLQPGSTKTVTEEPVQPLPPAPLPEPAPFEFKSQGDQNKISKIDRFMGRAEPAATRPLPATPVRPAPFLEDTFRPAPFLEDTFRPAPALPVEPEKQVQIKFEIEDPKSKPASNKSSNCMFDVLKTLCPEERKCDFEGLVNILLTEDVFYKSLVDILPQLSNGQRILLSQFLLATGAEN